MSGWCGKCKCRMNINESRNMVWECPKCGNTSMSAGSRFTI